MGNIWDKGKKIKTPKVTLVAENTTWDSQEGADMVARLQAELSPQDLQFLLEYKKHYPNGLTGYKNAYKTAKESVLKLTK